MEAYAEARRLKTVIGRDDERKLIQEALSKRQVIVLVGDGGVGKTFLLEHAVNLARQRSMLVPDVIDFYDTAMHSSRLLEANILQTLAQDNDFFSDYQRQAERLSPATVTEQQEEDLWKSFSDGYKKLTAKTGKRVLLCFDTAERLEYEQDSAEVQEDCEVDLQIAPSWTWLTKRALSLPATTVIIAARPTASSLLEALQKRKADIRRLREFSQEETFDYFRATEFGKRCVEDDQEMVEKIHLLSGGRPILVALSLDWLKRGHYDKRIHEESVQQLQAWQEEAKRGDSGNWEGIKTRFERDLVQRIRLLDDGLPLGRALRCLAVCRKGCNADLLTRLVGISLDASQALLADLQDLSFVKRLRSATGLDTFLHDEMYDLIEQHVLMADWPLYSEQARLDSKIIEWYDNQIADARNQILQLPSAQWRGREKLREREQLLMAERLYYQFDRNPRDGYAQYCRLDGEAIGSGEKEWDTLLRNEALWFTSVRAWRAVDKGPTVKINGKWVRNPTVDFDCRRRWVERFIARQEWDRAHSVALKLLDREKNKPANAPRRPALYVPGLLVCLATVEAYKGGPDYEKAREHSAEAIDLLETMDVSEREEWLYPYLLGTAYLYQGLALANALRLSAAESANNKAIKQFESMQDKFGKDQARLAEALNNQSYVYIRMGKTDIAERFCHDGLRIRQRRVDPNQLGLSLNTDGIIHERRNDPAGAIERSSAALEIFTDMGNKRGTILARINLGRALRRRARSPDWRGSEEDFRAGEKHLRDLLNCDVDMCYRVEVRNELGCLYRDWAAAMLEDILPNHDAVARLGLAIKFLRQAIRLTCDNGRALSGSEVLYLDSLDDLASVYYLKARTARPESHSDLRMRRRFMAQMEDKLDIADRELGLYRQEHPGEEWDELKLIMGKISFQRARLAVLRGQEKEAASLYGKAAILTEDYSADTPEARTFAEEAAEWLLGQAKIAPTAAQEYLNLMARSVWQTAEEEHLAARGQRLHEWVDSRVSPQLGIGWPDDFREAADG